MTGCDSPWLCIRICPGGWIVFAWGESENDLSARGNGIREKTHEDGHLGKARSGSSQSGAEGALTRVQWTDVATLAVPTDREVDISDIPEFPQYRGREKNAVSSTCVGPRK